MGVYSKNSTLLAEKTVDNGHLLDFIVENARNDMNMFNAIINIDIAEAYNEAGFIVLTEEEKNDTKEKAKVNIINKIKYMFAAAIAKIKQFVATFAAKVQNLISNDAKLYAKNAKSFGENWDKVELENWRPLKGFANNNLEDIIKDAKSTSLSSIDSAESKDAVNEALKDLKKDIKDKTKVLYYRTDFALFGEKQKKAHLDDSQKGSIDYIMRNSTKIIPSIKKIGDDAIKELKDTQKDLKFEKVQNKDNEIEMAKLNAKYNASSSVISYISKSVSASCGAMSRYIAAARKAFLKAANYKSNDQEATNASAIIFYGDILGECSDIYVESALSMTM